MEMRFYVGTDSAVEERSHAYYQEKLFLMAEGSKKQKTLSWGWSTTAPSQPAKVKSPTLLRAQVPPTGLFSSTVTIKLKLVTKRQQIQEGCLQSPPNSIAI